MPDLRVLLVEDDPLDAELTIRELRKSGYDLEWQRVDTQAEFMNRLAQDPPDLIISDHAMPQFSSSGPFQCLRHSGLTVPFIVVSNASGEEEAVGLMRSGAGDYQLEDLIGSCGGAVGTSCSAQIVRSQEAEDVQ